MSKAILISIKPLWCEMIVRGKKTVEVRKNKPNIEVPFKCYIYCTKAPKGWIRLDKNVQLDTKVIGEFVCDKIEHFSIDPKYDNLTLLEISRLSCVSVPQLQNYASGYWLFGWYISNLIIYNKPIELSKFKITRPPQSWQYVEVEK